MTNRGRKPSKTEDRKSRVIQTRVPQDLEDTLKDAAEKQRMTVSHFIRHVLEDTFNLVDGIVHDGSTLMENASRDAKRPDPSLPCARLHPAMPHENGSSGLRHLAAATSAAFAPPRP